jgi:hypothetical protein
MTQFVTLCEFVTIDTAFILKTQQNFVHLHSKFLKLPKPLPLLTPKILVVMNKNQFYLSECIQAATKVILPTNSKLMEHAHPPMNSRLWPLRLDPAWLKEAR